MDEIDFRIIQELIDNARITYRELAERLDLSANSVHKRVQAMTDGGAIREFSAHLTPKALPQVFVRICGTSATTRMDETIARLGRSPNTSVVVVSSHNSLHVVGILRDVSEMGRYVNFVVREGLLSNPSARLLDKPASPAGSAIPLSALDYRIVRSLQHDGRKLAVDIASELGVSTKTVRRHLDRLEREGLIFYRVSLDQASLEGIFALVDLYVKDVLKMQEIKTHISGKYSRNLLEIRTYSDIPDNVTIEVWAGTMAGLKALQGALQDEGVFENTILTLIYDVYRFETWRDQFVREHASAG